MKKLLAWICALTGITLLVSSSSISVMNKFQVWNREHMFNNAWYGKYDSKWGDLAKMSLLDGIKKFQEPKTYDFIKPADDGNKNIDLYLFGDSQTGDVPDHAYANTASYTQGRWFSYALNPAKKSILILETTERFVLNVYHDTDVYKAITRKDGAAPVNIYEVDAKKNYSRIVNKNLDYLMFEYNFINTIQRGKADMTYNLFDRASGDVAVSENGSYLFFKPTTLANATTSSYTPVDDNAVENVVANLNRIYDHYKKEGFTEVYLSIVPNPSSMLQPEGYNKLVPRIQHNPSLKMPYLDIYSIYNKDNKAAEFYRIGDNHWNNKGIQVWLSLVNTELRKKSAGK